MHTPIQVVMGSMLAVCAFAVRGGIEVLGRCAQMMVPIIVLLYVAFVLLLLPDLNPDRLFPVMEHGWVPSLTGSVVLQGWFSEFAGIAFLLPVLADQGKALRWSMISVASVALVLMLANLVTLMLFGGLTDRLDFPVPAAARYIHIPGFVEHPEAMVTAVWVFAVFLKIAVFYYLLVQCTARLSGLTDCRPVVLPLGVLVFLSGIWEASPGLQEPAGALRTSVVFEVLAMQLCIPVMLLVIAGIRRMKEKRKAVRS